MSICINSNNIRNFDDEYFENLINIDFNFNPEHYEYYDIINFSFSTYFKSVNLLKLSDHHLQLLKNSNTSESKLLLKLFNSDSDIKLNNTNEISNVLQNVSRNINLSTFSSVI